MTWIGETWIAMIVGFIVALVVTPVARRLGGRVGLIDVPNERSSHAVPTPRTGGIAILLGILSAATVATFLGSSSVPHLLFGAVTLAALSLYDDRRTLPHHFRLVVQIIVAIVVASTTQLVLRAMELPFVGTLAFGFLAIPVTVFWIVGVTNAFNFMDGINGIASSEAVICSITLGILLTSGGDLSGAILAAAISGAAAGFLLWNLGGSIFMGDVGSTALGFLLALLVLRAARVVPAPAAILPLTPFLFDAGLTIVIRAARGERFFSTAHRSHFYQRLVASGLTHHAVTLIYAALALISSALALVYADLNDPQRTAGILLLILLHVSVAAAAVRLQPQRKVARV